MTTVTVTPALVATRAPVAKLAGLVLFTTAVVTTRDITALCLAIAVTLALAPAFGFTPWRLLRLAWPVLAGAASVIISLSLFAADRSGTVLVEFGPVVISTTVLHNATSLALRLLAVALPSILVFRSVDPTDLADSLIQHLRVSPRFAIGALAAFRLVGLLQQEWRMIAMARRARGIDARGNPLTALKLFTSTAYALLVGAIRRGTRLAVAMDARGFDRTAPRGVSRPMPWTRADTAVVVSGAVLAALVIAVQL